MLVRIIDFSKFPEKNCNFLIHHHPSMTGCGHNVAEYLTSSFPGLKAEEIFNSFMRDMSLAVSTGLHGTSSTHHFLVNSVFFYFIISRYFNCAMGTTFTAKRTIGGSSKSRQKT